MPTGQTQSIPDTERTNEPPRTPSILEAAPSHGFTLPFLPRRQATDANTASQPGSVGEQAAGQGMSDIAGKVQAVVGVIRDHAEGPRHGGPAAMAERVARGIASGAEALPRPATLVSERSWRYPLGIGVLALVLTLLLLWLFRWRQ